MLALAAVVQGNGTSPAGDQGSRSAPDSRNELAQRTAAPKGARATRGIPDRKLLAPSDLQVIEEQVLGRGGAGNVYKGTLTGPRGPRAVAVKVLEGEPKPGEPPLEYILLEKALKGCKFVCKPLGYCEKDGKMCMVLHLYEKSLTKYIRERAGKDIPIREVVDIAKQLAEAVVTLHSKARIAHFDIKPDNVLLDAEGNCYLCDFSIAKEIPSHTRAVMLPHDAYGSTEYMAPEQVTTKRPGGIGFAADAWGLACTILELASGAPPFSGQAGVHNVMDVLNVLMNGNAPKIPQSVEPRLADIIKRSLIVAPPQRQDVTAMKHALSSLNELLRIEAGGIPGVPADVLNHGDIIRPDSLLSLGRSYTAQEPQEPYISGSNQSAPNLPPLNPPNAAPAPRGNSTTPFNNPTRRSPQRSAGGVHAAHAPTSPESTSTTGGALEADLLGLEHLTLDHRSVSGSSSVVPGPLSGSSRSRPPSAPTSLSNPAACAADRGPQWQAWPNSLGGSLGVGGQAAGSTSPRYEPTEAEHVVITAGSNGCLGVKTLFRSCTRLLNNPYDTKQMTGVAIVPTAHTATRDPSSRTFREAVSASAEGCLTWWDVSNGAVNASVSLTADPKVPAGAVGRSVVVDERFAVVGTDRSKVLVWQVGGGGSSWESVNRDVAQQDQATPSCRAVGQISSSNARPAAHSSDQNRIYDLTLQAPWMEDRGGSWVAGASSLGNLVIWDTATWREIYCSKATNGSIYSCCSLPGSNMVAVACPSPQLVQVWDCRQAPDNIAAVMTCDMPPRTAGGSASIGGSAGVADSGDSIYCVAAVPASGGAIPSQLLLGSKRGRLYLWDLRQSGVLWTVAQLQDKVLGCAASLCGRRVVAGSRAGQVAMLDWTKPLQGMQSTQAMHPYICQWKCSNPMYLWPRLEKGILRVGCGAMEPGSLFADPAAPGVTTSDA